MSRRRRITVLLVALLAAGSLTSCGTSERPTLAVAEQPARSDEKPATQEPAGPLDACALLTRADVATVVGEEPRKPKPAEAKPQLPGSDFVGSTCQYSGEGWRIRFFVERGHTESSKKVARMTFKGWKPVSGLGDEAWWGQSDPAKPGTMSVVSGTHAMVLNWFVSGGKVGPGSLENSTELVRRALARL
jgi:hypothetical protein